MSQFGCAFGALRWVAALSLGLALLLLLCGPAVAAPPSLEGGYDCYHDGKLLGACSVIARGDGTFLLVNEIEGHPPAIARPVDGDPNRYRLENWAPNCHTLTIIVGKETGVLILRFSNGSRWIRPL